MFLPSVTGRSGGVTLIYFIIFMDARATDAAELSERRATIIGMATQERAWALAVPLALGPRASCVPALVHSTRL